MSAYHLHARLFEGTLDAPTRNDTHTAETDEYEDAVDLADGLVAGGFTVWIYEHGPAPLVGGSGAYRVVRELRPSAANRS